MKFFISLLILKAQKRQTTFWIYQDNEYFVIINDRILLLKLSLRKNAANYFKDQRRHSIVLLMFHGTLCIILCGMWLTPCNKLSDLP